MWVLPHFVREIDAWRSNFDLSSSLARKYPRTEGERGMEFVSTEYEQLKERLRSLCYPHSSIPKQINCVCQPP